MIKAILWRRKLETFRSFHKLVTLLPSSSPLKRKAPESHHLAICSAFDDGLSHRCDKKFARFIWKFHFEISEEKIMTSWQLPPEDKNDPHQADRFEIELTYSLFSSLLFYSHHLKRVYQSPHSKSMAGNFRTSSKQKDAERNWNFTDHPVTIAPFWHLQDPSKQRSLLH